MLERLQLLVGGENLAKLQTKKVLVIGVGGVGGYVVEALTRSGIGCLSLVDHDRIEPTNVNRQIIALSSTIGQYKVDAFKKRIEDIGLSTQVEISHEFVTSANIDRYLEKVDFVVDACDTVSTKLAIIKACLERKIPFISCMGTGNKKDPSQLKIMELSKTSYDPLAKRLRKLIRENHLSGKIMVVASTEEKQVRGEKTIPSNAFVPATAGMLCASYVVNQIIDG